MAAARSGLSHRSAGDDLFDWHFTIRGLSGSEFEGGVYHGRMVLPSQYPHAPPDIYLLTPSGRFEVNRKICLSISSFHSLSRSSQLTEREVPLYRETWQPSWGVRTALLALRAFFPTDPKGAVGSLDASPEERKRLALASQSYKCTKCGYDAADRNSFAVLPEPSTDQSAPPPSVCEPSSKSEECELEVVAELGTPSEVPSPSASPPPRNSSVAASPSEPPTTIFPTAPSAPRSHAPSSASIPLPSPLADHPTSPSGPTPPRPHHHHHHHHPHHRAAPPTSPPGAPRLAHAHLPSPPSTSPALPRLQPQQQQLVRDGPPAAVPPQAAPLPPGVSLAQADVGGAGGPPSWIDRAILACLLALVAIVVRKIA
ncbi:SPOSA6832_01316, partial [Sporobolomyces salmonicolor]